MKVSRGVPEVPMLPTLHPQVRRFLQDLRESLVDVRGRQALPSNPSNVIVTPQAFGNLVQWTRGVNSDFHEVLWNTTDSIVGSHVVNVGDSAEWKDSVGNVGVTRYYWVRARKLNGPRSLETRGGPGTTLASGAGVTPPTPPPQSQNQYINRQTGGNEWDPRR